MFILDVLSLIWVLFLEMAPYIMLGLLFVAFLNFFINKEFIIKHSGKNNFASTFKAALFGIPLPLCSCGVIPTTVYLAKNGASKGSVLSFLIATPQTGFDSIIATYGMMGPVIAIYRPIAAFFMGIIGGTFGQFIKSPEFDREQTKSSMKFELNQFKQKIPLKEKIKKTINYSFVEFVDDISVQFIIGLFIAGLITYFIPDGFFLDKGFNNGLSGMLIILAVGIPMYVCATASIPIAISLIMKGFSPGVAFVFLAAGPATNAASITILYKSIGKNLTIAYILTISVLSILFGIILDWIFKWLSIDPMTQIAHIHEHSIHSTPLINIIISLIFAVLLILSIYRKTISKYFKKEKGKEMSEDKFIKLNIEGMTCNHCVANVKKVIENTPGVEEFEVSLSDNSALVKGDVNIQNLTKSIEDIGYKVSKVL
jgi:uncharacterized membrane protein YraQ (UPF0718 family)/copper chaperone CopZ